MARVEIWHGIITAQVNPVIVLVKRAGNILGIKTAIENSKTVNFTVR